MSALPATADTVWELTWQEPSGEVETARVRVQDPAGSLKVIRKNGGKIINLKRVEN